MAKAVLGSMVGSVRGSVGGVVVTTGRGGTVLKRKPVYRRPTSPAQALAEGRMRAASALWSGLSAAQAARWRAWGEARGRTAQTAFIALATKILQIDPAAAVPLAPPTHDFVADDVAVTASEPPSFACERGGQGGESENAGLSTPQPPPLTGVKGGGAGVLFSTTGPNRPGTVTELLLQPLLNERRSPGKDYKTAGFVQFNAAAPTHLLSLAPGSYAVGYRFVERATGQRGPTILLGVVKV